MSDLVVFRVGGSSYALSVDAVREVRDIGPISPSLDSRRHFVGLTRVRDRWIPVVDLPREWQGGSRVDTVTQPSCLIILGRDHGRLGLRVDDFSGVVSLEVAQLDAVPPSGAKSYIRANGELVRCIDPAALFAFNDRLLGDGGGAMAENRATAESIQLVIFQIGPEEFGLDVMSVYEVLAVPEIRAVPQAPDFVEGVTERGDCVMPVIDLRKRFGLAEVTTGGSVRLLVVAMKESRVGLVVDAVPGVLECAADALDPPPDYFKGIAARYLKGIVKNQGRLVLLLDVDEILTSEERIALETVAATDEPGSDAGDGTGTGRRKSRKGRSRRTKKKDG